MSSPSNHRQPLTTSPACVSAQGEGRAATSSDSGRCYRHHIATPRRRSTSSRPAPRRSAILPAPSSSPSFMWRGRAEQTKQEEKELARRMPPLSSPVPRLSSAPSDVYTVHTIASRSPPHPLATSHRVREGRPPRPVQGDAIATPRHHIASEQQPQGIASTFCHPARLVHVLFLSSSSSHPSGGKGRAPSQPGMATPSRSPFRPSPPCRGASAYMRTPPKVGEGVVSTY